MKRILFILLLFVAVSAKGQTNVYHPFPDSDAVWNVHYNVGDPFSCIDDLYYSYVIGNDTTIGAFIYHKVNIPFEVNLSAIPCGTTFIGYQGAIRQDTIVKKVYFLERDSTTEKVLYDFNLHVGDTLKYGISKWAVCSFLIDTVSSIDSILIGNTYRKEFSFNGYQLIEGIGGTNGLLEMPCAQFAEIRVFLLCFKQNGITLYPDTSTVCNNVNAINNLSEKNTSFTLSPNPFHTTATLEIKNEGLRMKNLEMKIYNTMGRLVRTIALEKSGGEVIIPRGELSDGLYFYQLVSEDGETVAGKFVVE